MVSISPADIALLQQQVTALLDMALGAVSAADVDRRTLVADTGAQVHHLLNAACIMPGRACITIDGRAVSDFRSTIREQRLAGQTTVSIPIEEADALMDEIDTIVAANERLRSEWRTCAKRLKVANEQLNAGNA